MRAQVLRLLAITVLAGCSRESPTRVVGPSTDGPCRDWAAHLDDGTFAREIVICRDDQRVASGSSRIVMCQCDLDPDILGHRRGLYR